MNHTNPSFWKWYRSGGRVVASKMKERKKFFKEMQRYFKALKKA